ncbi:ABC transporter ATP-binding protein [Desulfogranum marinum]|uniref:ABC transporter ATP-binding protein n=1 Tax=Desulfogranum marinum TaxID=453220 RepID=UPI001966512C|nr:ABC transporter ATP-binding protein [Desulfogranum marinum]MBM9512046.1 ABC transporter ATP-binding protein [Desulfogranum marinum]
MLTLDSITAGYGELTVLTDLSVTLEKGETVCLIGPNGAGKSTVLRVVAGQLRPTKGKVLFNGHDVSGKNCFEKIKMGILFVPQGRNVFPSLSLKENLNLSRIFISEDLFQKRMETVLATFPWMKDKLGDPAGSLSGGLRQMLALSRILLLSPQLVLLDEPSLGLSPLIVDEIFALISSLNQQGISFLLVEQNASKGLSIAHRGYVLESGKNRLTGTGRHLLKDPEVQRLYLGG